jgi:hypothetical protein
LFVTRLIINQINKVQWVDFKLENVLVSLHSLKTMGLGSIIFKEWRVTFNINNLVLNVRLYIQVNILTSVADELIALDTLPLNDNFIIISNQINKISFI